MRFDSMSQIAPTARARWLIGSIAAVVVAACLAAPAFATPASDQDQRSPRATEDTVKPATAQAAQKLRWTADNSTDAYKAAPEEAEAGPTTIEFENSEATGNTSGMQHTLTFDTSTPGYNHDVDVDILATPSDENNGKWTTDVVLTEGTYLYICTIPGHGQMKGELVVKGGGDPGDDKTPPKASAKVEGEQNNNGAYLGSATVSVSATDEGSGVDTVEYNVDGNGWKQYSDPVEVTKLGQRTVRYRATDKAGNTSDVGTKKFTVVKDDGKDRTPPKVNAMLHGKTNADGAYVGHAEVMLNATDDDSGVDTVEYRLNDQNWKAYDQPFKVTKQGQHTVRYRATDKAGNTSDVATKKFKVVPGADDDTEPPQVSATLAGQQDADWNYLGAVQVKVAASDSGSGLDKVEYRLDDGDWTAYEKAIAVEDEGEHTFDYRATDAVGNKTGVQSTAFTIVADEVPPECATPDPSPTVVMGDAGSGVRNRAAGNGCTVDDRISDEARWVAHSDFVAHVRSALRDLAADGYITEQERTKILNAAKRSSVGN